MEEEKQRKHLDWTMATNNTIRRVEITDRYRQCIPGTDISAKPFLTQILTRI